MIKIGFDMCSLALFWKFQADTQLIPHDALQGLLICMGCGSFVQVSLKLDDDLSAFWAPTRILVGELVT